MLCGTNRVGWALPSSSCPPLSLVLLGFMSCGVPFGDFVVCFVLFLALLCMSVCVCVCVCCFWCFFFNNVPRLGWCVVVLLFGFCCRLHASSTCQCSMLALFLQLWLPPSRLAACFVCFFLFAIMWLQTLCCAFYAALIIPSLGVLFSCHLPHPPCLGWVGICGKCAKKVAHTAKWCP